MKKWFKSCLLICLMMLGVCSVSANAATVKLNETKLTLYKGQTAKLQATVEDATGSVKWKSSKKAVATVNQNGKITAKKVGKTTITVKVDGVTAQCTVTVKKPTITLDAKSLSLYKGDKVTLHATVKGKSRKVTWKSSKKSVATVNSDGKITAKKKGTVTITATANGVTAKCKVTVKQYYTKDQAEKGLKKYVSKNETTNYYYFYEGKSGDEYTFWVTFRGPFTKMKYYVNAKTGNIYESGIYFGVNEWKSTDKKRLVGNISKYL